MSVGEDLASHDSTLFDPQIREKLTQLQEKRDKINNKWQDKMDYLQIGTNLQTLNHNWRFSMTRRHFGKQQQQEQMF